VAFLRPGSAVGFGPYGIVVGRLTYEAPPR
jgi:hypothetical protein